MSECKEKMPEPVSAEDNKVTSASAAEKHLNKRQENTDHLRNLSASRGKDTRTAGPQGEYLT